MALQEQSSSNPSPELIAAIIPCYRVKDHILDVIRSIPNFVSKIYVIDDKCPQETGSHVQLSCADKRVIVISHEKNRGVGGATITGFKRALADGAEILVKIDGDGQMRLDYLEDLISPLIARLADFSKGNRFFDLNALRSMPLIRRVGNMSLSLLTKFVSGNWHISDPTNGFFAIHRAALQRMNLAKLDPRFFFETSLLIQLNIIRAVLIDVPIPAQYGTEQSNLKIGRILLEFPKKLIIGSLRRVMWRYFIYDINAVSVLLFTGFIFLFGGLSFGFDRLAIGVKSHIFQSAGTVAFASLPIILGFIMLMQAMLLDIIDIPRLPLQFIARRRTR